MWIYQFVSCHGHVPFLSKTSVPTLSLSYSVDIERFSPGVKRPWRESDHSSQLVPRLRESVTVAPLPCSIMVYRDNLSFCYSIVGQGLLQSTFANPASLHYRHPAAWCRFCPNEMVWAVTSSCDDSLKLSWYSYLLGDNCASQVTLPSVKIKRWKSRLRCMPRHFFRLGRDSFLPNFRSK